MQCQKCKNQFSATMVVCLFYPEGIPEEILWDEEECPNIKKEEEKDESAEGTSGEERT